MCVLHSTNFQLVTSQFGILHSIQKIKSFKQLKILVHTNNWGDRTAPNWMFLLMFNIFSVYDWLDVYL